MFRRKTARWSTFAIALSILQLPLIALADDEYDRALDHIVQPMTDSNADMNEMPDMDLGEAKEQSDVIITAGVNSTTVTGGPQDTTTASVAASAGLRYYRFRTQPGGGSALIDEDLNLHVDLGGGEKGLVGGGAARARVGIGWHTGNEGPAFYGALIGNGEMNLHSNPVEGNTGTVSVGGELGLLVGTVNDLNLTIAPTIAARIGETGDDSLLALVMGGRLRLAAGGEGKSYLTLEGSRTLAGTGDGDTTEFRGSYDVHVSEDFTLGGDLTVTAISNLKEKGLLGTSTETVTTVVPAVNVRAGYAF